MSLTDKELKDLSANEQHSRQSFWEWKRKNQWYIDNIKKAFEDGFTVEQVFESGFMSGVSYEVNREA